MNNFSNGILGLVPYVATQDKVVPTDKWKTLAQMLLDSAESMEDEWNDAYREKTQIVPGGTLDLEEPKSESANFLYAALSDPQLNRGLGNLAENAADILFGKESGNALVDYGLSNIPAFGSGAILAAGGIPGLVDLAGTASMKGVGGIAKNVAKKTKKEKNRLRKLAKERNRAEWEAAEKRRAVKKEAVRLQKYSRNSPEAVVKSGWKPDEHPLRNYPEGYKRTSDDVEKRNIFVADSIADHVLKGLKPYGPDGRHIGDIKGETKDIAAWRHQGTNYDELQRKFNSEIKRNAEDQRFIEKNKGQGIDGELYDKVFRRIVKERMSL